MYGIGGRDKGVLRPEMGTNYGQNPRDLHLQGRLAEKGGMGKDCLYVYGGSLTSSKVLFSCRAYSFRKTHQGLPPQISRGRIWLLTPKFDIATRPFLIIDM